MEVFDSERNQVGMEINYREMAIALKVLYIYKVQDKFT